MATHFEDEEQAERLKQWWKENWIALVGGLVIGLAAIFGWEGWKIYRDGRHATASRMYEDLKLAVQTDRTDDTLRIGEALIKDHASSPYASGAALFLAAEAVKADDLATAQQHLRWVRERGYDDGVRQIARLREARVVWQQGQMDEALKLLDGKSGRFGALFEELRGDIRLAQGDRNAARAAYEKALSSTEDDGSGARNGLQRKIDDLTEGVQS